MAYLTDEKLVIVGAVRVIRSNKFDSVGMRCLTPTICH